MVYSSCGIVVSLDWSCQASSLGPRRVLLHFGEAHQPRAHGPSTPMREADAETVGFADSAPLYAKPGRAGHWPA